MIGTCKVEGRKVVLSGGDFTIRGGASDANIGNKRDHAESFALSARIPFVHLLDSTGGSVKTLRTSTVFKKLAPWQVHRRGTVIA